MSVDAAIAAARADYAAAVASGDRVAELACLIRIADVLVKSEAPLAAPRLIEEALGLAANRRVPLSLRERSRALRHLLGLWARVGLKQGGGSDPSRYWFFRT